ncbi:hypothetical protein E9A21_005066, partial [Escherichia coli]|nr:hypothetical protein [Escherichia coli]
MGEVKHQNGRHPGIGKEAAMALYIDISAIAGQVRVIRAVTKRYAPLLQKVSGECTEDIVNDFVIELRGLIFSLQGEPQFLQMAPAKLSEPCGLKDVSKT